MSEAFGLVRCVRCGENKGREEFHSGPRKRNKLVSYCKACVVVYARQYRANNRNKDAPVLGGTKWCPACSADLPRASFARDATKDGLNPYCRVCRLDKSREWYARTPGIRKASQAVRAKAQSRRNARVLAAPGRATKTQVAARVAMFGGTCAYCPGPYEDIEHTIPLSRGGSNWPANLRPVCRACNSSKGTKTLSEWTNRIWDFKERTIVGFLTALQLFPAGLEPAHAEVVKRRPD